MRREAEQRNYPDLLEQLRNDVNSSNLIENGEIGEEDSTPSEAHVSMEHNTAEQVDGEFENDSFALTNANHQVIGAAGMTALQASPVSEPKIIVNSMRIDTSADMVNKTSEDFYSKISSID